MQSHPNHHFSASLRTEANVNAVTNSGLNYNKIIDATEDALRMKIWEGARDAMQVSEQAVINLSPTITPTTDQIVSYQWEVKFANTTATGGKTFNWRSDGGIRFEINIETDASLVNSIEYSTGLYKGLATSTATRKVYRNPGYSTLGFRLYDIGSLNAPNHGYPGTANPNTIQFVDGNGTNFNPGGVVANYSSSESWVMAPSQHYGQGKTAIGGTQPFIFKTGIWYRITQSLKYLGSDNWQAWTWISSEQDDPVLILADKDNPIDGYPIFDWAITEFDEFMYEFNNSASVASQDQYVWGRNFIAFDGDHVPLGGRPNGKIDDAFILPTSTVKTARAYADFGSVTSFNVAFASRGTAANEVYDDDHWIVAIVTVENAANRTITISDNGSNTWQVVEQTATTEANRCIIARTSGALNNPTQVTIAIDSAVAGMCWATIYEVENAATVDSDSVLTTSATTHGGMSVATTKQGLLFGGFVGDSDDPAGYATTRVTISAVASQTEFTIASGLFAGNVGANELVASILYSAEQYQVIPVVSYNNTTGVVVLEYASRNPDNTLTTSATVALIYRPKWVDRIEIDVSPKNWDLFWPIDAPAEGWSSPAPNHIHGVRAVFESGTWDFPIKTTSAENASSVLVSLE
jgi:hypothetical protein